MEYISTGKIIKEFRERRKLSQLQLCEGLCEPPSLCKIETGKQNPNKKLLDALAAKLQIPIALNVPVTRIEFERAQIEREIVRHISMGDYNIYSLLEQYDAVHSNMDRLEKQFYLFASSVYESFIKNDFSSALKGFMESIQITFSSYKIGMDISGHLFIPIEITLLNNFTL